MDQDKDLLIKVHRSLGQLEGKLEGAVATITASTERLEDELKDARKDRQAVHARISKVENKLHWYSGAAAAMGALVVYWENVKGILGKVLS